MSVPYATGLTPSRSAAPSPRWVRRTGPARSDRAGRAAGAEPLGVAGPAWRRLRTRPGGDPRAPSSSLVFVLSRCSRRVLAPYGPPGSSVGRAEIRPGFIPGPSRRPPAGLDRSGADELSQLIYGARQSLVIGVVSRPSAAARSGCCSVCSPGRSAAGSTASSCAWSTSCWRSPACCSRSASRRCSGQSPTSRDDRHRDDPGADLRPAAARVDAVPARAPTTCWPRGRSGCRGRDIVLSHVLPNSVGPVIVQATLILATAIIDVAGAVLPRPGQRRPQRRRVGPDARRRPDASSRSPPAWRSIRGIAIAVVALGFTLLGESLREALDPKNRR